MAQFGFRDWRHRLHGDVDPAFNQRATSETVSAKGAESKLPSGTQCVIGDALRTDSYTSDVWRTDTFVHLIGVPHPSPVKAKQFHDVDLVSIKVCDQRRAGRRVFAILSI